MNKWKEYAKRLEVAIEFASANGAPCLSCHLTDRCVTREGYKCKGIMLAWAKEALEEDENGQEQMEQITVDEV